MKRKEIKNLAKRIAHLEIELQLQVDKEERAKIEDEIMRLSSHINSIEDMVALDEEIQNLL